MNALNRCHWCNKFRRWEDLEYSFEYSSGHFYPKEIMQCKKGTGCEK